MPSVFMVRARQTAAAIPIARVLVGYEHISPMLEVYGNLWEVPADLRVITTNGTLKKNGRLVMGKGCAKEALERYPGIDKKLGTLVSLHGNHCFMVADDHIATFPTKDDWRKPSFLKLIERSAYELATLMGWNAYERIVLPRPGCGAGGLDWDDVRPVLDEYLDDRFSVITFGS